MIRPIFSLYTCCETLPCCALKSFIGSAFDYSLEREAVGCLPHCLLGLLMPSFSAQAPEMVNGGMGFEVQRSVAERAPLAVYLTVPCLLGVCQLWSRTAWNMEMSCALCSEIGFLHCCRGKQVGDMEQNYSFYMSYCSIQTCLHTCTILCVQHCNAHLFFFFLCKDLYIFLILLLLFGAIDQSVYHRYKPSTLEVSSWYSVAYNYLLNISTFVVSKWCCDPFLVSAHRYCTSQMSAAAQHRHHWPNANVRCALLAESKISSPDSDIPLISLFPNTHAT